MTYQNTLSFAKEKDNLDELKKYRNEFHLPIINNKPVIYFTGNSLGLQPKKTQEYINQELKDWANWGVEGHFHGKNPWFSYHEISTNKMAKVVGALPEEVVVMGSLSTNIHLLMVSFYQPKGERTKIICEAKAFPSDQYILETQVKHHNLNPDDTIIEIHPRKGEELIREEDILAKINEVGDELALVMIGGVNYYTGQYFDLKSITEAGHKVGAKVGFDLAHAAGNVNLKLHEWGVDFAAWCTYKYLNSGPGGVSGIFINKTHCENKELNRFGGWWGQVKETRFLMEKGFDPIPTAEGWQMSNAPILLMAALNASLDVFEEAGMDKIAKKRDDLTAYLEFILADISARNNNVSFDLITPKDKTKRGAQLSIAASGQGKALFDKLTEQNVLTDWREPNVIRVAPAPLYNSYEDCFRFGEILEKSLK
jgi:kynureninase